MIGTFPTTAAVSRRKIFQFIHGKFVQIKARNSKNKTNKTEINP